MARISLAELESYLWESANFLRGHIDAGDYKQYIFPLLFLKRLSDVWEEEFSESIKEYGEDYTDEHHFIIPKGCHWKDIRETANDVGGKIQKAMQSIDIYCIYYSKSFFSNVFHWIFGISTRRIDRYSIFSFSNFNSFSSE